MKNLKEKQILTTKLRESLIKDLKPISKEEFIAMCDREYERGFGEEGFYTPSKWDLGYAEAMRICRNIACTIIVDKE